MLQMASCVETLHEKGGCLHMAVHHRGLLLCLPVHGIQASMQANLKALHLLTHAEAK